MRASLGDARLPRLAVTAALAVLVIVVTACTGTGSGVPSPAPSQSLALVASEAPSEAPSETSSEGGGRGDYDYGTAASPEASAVPGPATRQVGAATGTIGAYLTGGHGLTLYTFKPDSANTSTCTDACAQAWPPFTIGADDTLEAGDGVSGALTTFARADGTLQIAYNGAPLYYFAKDTQPGDTNGQGLGGAWFVAKP